jgi:hypothetical protein
MVAHPAIARVAGIRRAYGTRQAAKTAILTEDLRRVVRACQQRRWPGSRPGVQPPPDRSSNGEW